VTTIHFDTSAIGAVLKSSAVRSALKKKAEEIAGHVDDQGLRVGAFLGGQGPIDLPVRVTTDTTDRAVAFVTIAHPAGIAAQAKHGVLTRAASAAGVSVHSD
jgi:hypothetical protein